MSDFIIKVKDLRKTYYSHKKEPGIRGSVKSLIKRSYNEVKALKGLSFNIEEGEFVGYIGPNGAGKTTTLKILSGVLYPTAGEVRVMDFVPWHRKNSFRQRISFVMGQKSQLWWDLPAMDSLLLNKEIYKIPGDVFSTTLDEVSSLLNVKNLLLIPVRQLSLGERMKMELLASLIHRPRVLFLDEPTIGLDIVSQKNIKEFLREYNKKERVTIIFTTHYVKDIQELCSRVILLHKGEIFFDGNIEKLLYKYAPYKMIKITFLKEIPREISQYGEIVTRDELKVVMRTRKEETSETFNNIIKKYEITDVSVEVEPIEDTIHRIFSGITEDA